MKLTDYLAQYLAQSLGLRHVFLVIGGACAHIVDSLGNNKAIKYICFQHEQAAAMAADAYARLTKNMGVCVVTSGPGATNLITGLCCSYFDSIPTLMISGQVNEWETKGDRNIRQLGFQDTDIVSIVKSITKYAVMVKDPNEIRYHLDKAIYLAKTGRPGPVWLDIPMNVQHAEIEPDKLVGFDPKELKEGLPALTNETTKTVLESLKKAKRPVIILGSGVKIARAQDEFFKFIDKLKSPVVSTWSGMDIIPHKHSLYVGQFGVYGNRAANFTVQNADLVISIGSRLDTRQTGGQPQTFAREAKKIVVDIDHGELTKQWVAADMPIQADAKDFLQKINEEMLNFIPTDFSSWLARAMEWKEKYPSVLPEFYEQKNSVNSYVFIRTLSDKLEENSIIITDQGGNLTWTMQTFEIKKGQELFSAFGNSPMGYALPASIGAAFARPDQNIICIDGDGGFQLNIQELQTVKYHNLPIKIFILNNHSYGIIKQFQEIYFDGRYVGTNPESGYSMPDFIKVAQAYGLPTNSITNHDELPQKLDEILATPGPVLVDVLLDPAQKLIPKLVAVKTPDGQRYISKPLEDMVPLLPREEFMAGMIIEPLPDEQSREKATEIN